MEEEKEKELESLAAELIGGTFSRLQFFREITTLGGGSSTKEGLVQALESLDLEGAKASANTFESGTSSFAPFAQRTFEALYHLQSPESDRLSTTTQSTELQEEEADKLYRLKVDKLRGDNEYYKFKCELLKKDCMRLEDRVKALEAENRNLRELQTTIFNTREKLESKLLPVELEQDCLRIDGKPYLFLTSNTDFTQLHANLASIPEKINTREIILLDFSSSKLQNTYQRFSATIANTPLPVNQLLPKLMDFLKTTFSAKLAKEQHIEGLSRQVTLSISEKLIPAINLETFVEDQCGVSRHKALLAAYLLGELAKNHLLLEQEIAIYYYRDRLEDKGNGFAWVILHYQCNTLLIDFSTNKSYSLINKDGLQTARKFYSDAVVNLVISRFIHKDLAELELKFQLLYHKEQVSKVKLQHEYLLNKAGLLSKQNEILKGYESSSSCSSTSS